MKEVMKKLCKIKKIKDNNVSQRGITMVALVITIIVLLILAGITIPIVLRRRWFNSESTTSEKITKRIGRRRRS